MTVDEAIERLTEFKRVYGGDCNLIARDSDYGKIFDSLDLSAVKKRNSNNQCQINIKGSNADD